MSVLHRTLSTPCSDIDKYTAETLNIKVFLSVHWVISCATQRKSRATFYLSNTSKSTDRHVDFTG